MRAGLPEAPGAHVVPQIAIRAGDQLEVALRFLVRTHRKETLFLDGLQQHRLLVATELANLIQEHDAFVRLPQQAGAVGLRARERTFHMPEQRRHRGVPAQRCAVDLHEVAP